MDVIMVVFLNVVRIISELYGINKQFPFMNKKTLNKKDVTYPLDFYSGEFLPS